MRKRQQIYRFAFLNQSLVLKIVLIAFSWYLCYKSYDIVKDIEEIKGFIPHEILNINQDASLAEIKRAYRRLSREKHPDKNPDNPAAVTDFIQITKAYTIMTDPVARENFLRFGSPDGYGNFHVSMALPKVLS
mmetsp:Transcript_11126/g.18671  ORF Transcript_11126/g.18671 Transcript_11126/m.18671 type:complete len:133 (+) Transcript_11126:231-629(+)